MGNAILAGISDLGAHTPDALISVLFEEPPIDVVEFSRELAHPITSETITKYQKLMNEPLLHDVWSKLMCSELGRLAQGFGETEGTDTTHFVSHNKILMFQLTKR